MVLSTFEELLIIVAFAVVGYIASFYYRAGKLPLGRLGGTKDAVEEEAELYIYPTDGPRSDYFVDEDTGMTYKIDKVDPPLRNKDDGSIWETTYYMVNPGVHKKVNNTQVWRDIDPYDVANENVYLHYSSKGRQGALQKRMIDLQKENSRLKVQLQSRDSYLDRMSTSIGNQRRMLEEEKGAEWRGATTKGRRYIDYPTENQKAQEQDKMRD